MSEYPVPMKHDTPENKAIADANTVLRVQVGSGLHGVTVSDQDDRDEMGVCIEPPEYVIGLRRFEQYEYRTQQMHVRSGPGDLDLNVYSLRKWTRLAADGNPTVLLFAPDSEIVSIAWPGYDLRARREMFLSRQAGARFVGYLERQRDRMLGKLSQRTNRPELVAKYGFDTKFAYHAARLGVQGVELLTTGKITLPVPPPERAWMLDIRQGRITKDAVLLAIDTLRTRLVELTDGLSDLPERPDHAAINDWLVSTYTHWWDGIVPQVTTDGSGR